MINKHVTFLLIEDDDVDIMAMRRTFKTLGITNRIVVARNGLEGLAALRGSDGFEKIDKPFIILLDLNMPQMCGLEFLDEIRVDPQLKTAVVFVMTTSNHDQDRISAYERHVTGYVLKSKPLESFMDAVRMINQYWQVVELP